VSFLSPIVPDWTHASFSMAGGASAPFSFQKSETVGAESESYPFSYVRTPNESLGAPSWAALDAVLVDSGWRPDTEIADSTVTLKSSDPLFLPREDSVHGWIRSAPGITDETWALLSPLLEHADTYPYGQALEAIIVERN
jgi:hypothetical protein